MPSKKTTHVRVERDIVSDFNKEMPGVKHSDIIRVSWQQYKAVQKMGRFVYGNVWKQSKKK